MTAPHELIVQVDAVLAEDNQTVVLHGYTANEALYMQSFELDEPITEANFDHRAAAKRADPKLWRKV